MEKNTYVGYRTSETERAELRKLAEQKGFGSLSDYLRKLVEQDRTLPEGAAASPEKKKTEAGQTGGDTMLTLLELNRKLDRLFGHTYKSTNVRSNYENLRNAVVALGLYGDDPKKLAEYLKGLFKGEIDL